MSQDREAQGSVTARVIIFAVIVILIDAVG